MDNYTFKVTMETKMRKYSVELSRVAVRPVVRL